MPSHGPGGVVVDDRFVLCARIGHGAMAVVYRARDRQRTGWVAIKLLRPVHAEKRKFKEALTTEAAVLTQIHHRHVVGFIGAGAHAGLPYIAMEHLDGGSLHGFLRALPQRRLAVLSAVSVLQMVCRGVQAVHDAGFAHCDLKARNILVDRRGRVVVGDLGLARQTTTGGLVNAPVIGGTADYMAPEVIEGLSGIVAATLDVYALGVLAFELFTGRRPFRGLTAQEVFSQRLGRAAPLASTIRSDLPTELATVIGRAMEKNPAIRTVSATAFEAALAAAAAPLRQEARYRSRSDGRR